MEFLPNDMPLVRNACPSMAAMPEGILLKTLTFGMVQPLIQMEAIDPNLEGQQVKEVEA